jgi:hypothetical protein
LQQDIAVAFVVAIAVVDHPVAKSACWLGLNARPHENSCKDAGDLCYNASISLRCFLIKYGT